MPSYTLSTLLAVAAATSVAGQATYTYTSGTPLASKHFDYPNLPYQADPDDGVRGTQTGFNLCNSTTAGQTSMCQTSFLNHLDDFCLWAPPTGPDTIGDTEQLEVAWCTKGDKGTRVIPGGALQGVQYMVTPDYVQVVGFIDQTQILLLANDTGGELDPHGADFRGNPLGGLVYSNAFKSNNGNNGSYQQVIEWHNFMGGGMFCFKACDPAGAHAADYCQHVFDRIGCLYNAPNNAQNGSFTACEGDSQDYPGIYTDASGQVQTFTQPAESLGAISTMPYQPKVPASSNCVTFSSAALFAAATPTPSAGASGSASGAAGAKPTGSKSAAASGSKSGSAAPAGSTGTSGAGSIGVSIVSTVFGVALAVAFLG